MRFARNDTSRVYVDVSDVHVPYQDKKACAAVADLLDDLRPDGLVVDGDFVDLIELSKHSRGSVAQLEGLRVRDTFEAGRAQLRVWRDAGGKKMEDNHLIDGNHEDRLRRWLETGDNAVWIGDDAVDIAKRLGLAEIGFQYHPGYPEAHIKLGKLLVTHGRWTTEHAPATHLNKYGCSVITGHGHRPGMHYGSALEKQKAGYMQGHLASVRSRAMKYAPVPNAWCLGFSVIQVEKSGIFHVQLVNFFGGAFYFGGRRYGGR